MLTDILVTSLNKIEVQGGNVLHVLRHFDEGYQGFGEAYFSSIDFCAVKAWKRHNKMTMNLVVPLGIVKFVFHDRNIFSDKIFRVEVIGDSNYSRLTVPPGIWFGFQGVSSQQALILNIASHSHDPNEADRLDLSDIEYNWVNS